MTEQPPDGLVTTDQAADLLGIDPSLISKWKHRHKVTPAGMVAGRGRGGRVPLYRIDELRPLAEEYLERLARHADRAEITDKPDTTSSIVEDNASG